MNKNTLHGFLEYLDIRKNEGTIKAISGEARTYLDDIGGCTKIGEKRNSVLKMVRRKYYLNAVKINSEFICYPCMFA